MICRTTLRYLAALGCKKHGVRGASKNSAAFAQEDADEFDMLQKVWNLELQHVKHGGCHENCESELNRQVLKMFKCIYFPLCYGDLLFVLRTSWQGRRRQDPAAEQRIFSAAGLSNHIGT